MAWFAAPTGKRGRQPVFSDAAIQTCLMIKALFGLPLRQTTGLVASLVKLAGLDWPTPDFSTLCRRQKELDVTIGYRPAKDALHLLVPSRGLLANRCRAADSTGIKVAGDGEWSARKHGPSKPRQWRKVHLGVDADTLEMRAVEVTGSRVGDAPMLPALLDQIPEDQSIDAVTAPSRRMQAFACRSTDGAFDTRACHATNAARGAQAVIPPRKNGKPWKEDTAGAHVRNEALRASRRFGRAIWRRWSGYHRRSRVETKMRCFKALGERIVARDFERQVAELHIRVAVLNRFTALGTPVTQRVA